ncbi:hypothetical protein [Desulfobacula phenolica]|uniref:Uncharacterized protein n=1 Tax=Desulfobacula phenolica TaxID=90732 RepID=A0A1H2H6K3_9BACT|nr:hypothetical protein [Desulfobacula phenolica]SDU27454.1 hypothetical protein SAMN04487931_10672 [Desulfobacula phenolica]
MDIPILILITLVLIILAILRTDCFARLILGGLYGWLVVKIVQEKKVEKDIK